MTPDPPERRPDQRSEADKYRVVLRREAGETIYVVVNPSGDPLYTFTDQRKAFDEAKALNNAETDDPA